MLQVPNPALSSRSVLVSNPGTSPRTGLQTGTPENKGPTVLFELTARKLYTYYQADIKAYVIVMQNISCELCRRLRRAGSRIAELQVFRAKQ